MAALAEQEVFSDDYNESEDSDFADDGIDEQISSSDDEDAAADRPAKKRRITKANDAGDIEPLDLDSGDEATIQRAKEKRRKKKGKKARFADEEQAVEDEEDGDGDGAGPGFVRTRQMRAKIKEQNKKPLIRPQEVTVDVNSLWNMMNAPDSTIGLAPSTTGDEAQVSIDKKPSHSTPVEPAQEINLEETIKIKRVYRFAGEVHVEEKEVPKESREAREYLANQANKESTDNATEAAGDDGPPLRRPMRKISRFDPNPEGLVGKSWTAASTSKAHSKGKDAAQLNTVEKSKLDWAGYVDREGIQEELDKSGKAKEGYLGRMDFLGRTEMRREEDARRARLSGRV